MIKKTLLTLTLAALSFSAASAQTSIGIGVGVPLPNGGYVNVGTSTVTGNGNYYPTGGYYPNGGYYNNYPVYQVPTQVVYPNCAPVYSSPSCGQVVVPVYRQPSYYRGNSCGSYYRPHRRHCR